MKIIKLALISAFVFFLLITGISLLIPAHIRISKAVDIRTSREALMEQLQHPSNWKNWYPGADTANLIIAGTTMNGFVNGRQMSMQISSTSDSNVVVLMSRTGSPDAEMGWNIFEANTPGAVTVQWYMDFHLRWFPWEKFSGLMFEKRYGPLMELGLNQLKQQLEN